jgi:orotidine-5'-phosphate decarboxylase
VSANFADRLLAAVQRKGAPVCVGIDPVYDRLPEGFRGTDAGDDAQIQSVRRYCLELLEVVAPIVPAVKPQSAYFEIYRAKGVEAYFDVVRRARELGLIVIGDVKRNDIGSTAEAYARGHLSGSASPDAITVNGYLGADGIHPFVEVARDEGKGVFVLVRTSNPSGAVIQDFADAAGRKLYEHIAEQVAAIGSAEGLVGERGFSCVGAVVGATYPDEARRLRRIMPQQVFLVPGYGAQGATAGDCAAAFTPDGTGAIVNASRSVIFAYNDRKYAGMDWRKAVETAAKAFAQDMKRGQTTNFG